MGSVAGMSAIANTLITIVVGVGMYVVLVLVMTLWDEFKNGWDHSYDPWKGEN
jgi:hypothetical protein